MNTDEFKPIVMAEEYWRNTYLSVAKYSGIVKIGEYTWIIVDKRGRDIFECSDEASKTGRRFAIEPGEPADLCRTDFVKIYRKLGRERFLQFVKENPDINTVKAANASLKEWQK